MLPTTDTLDDLMTIQRVAEYAGVNHKTVQRWVRDDGLTAILISERIRRSTNDGTDARCLEAENCLIGLLAREMRSRSRLAVASPSRTRRSLRPLPLRTTKKSSWMSPTVLLSLGLASNLVAPV